MQDSDMIPFKTSPLPDGPWLVFAPHADDETFGMGGSLLLAREMNIPVSLIILTDGAQGGGDNSDIKALIKTRRQEVLDVVAQAGINDVFFLEQADQHLISHHKLIQQIVALIGQTPVKSIFFPALTEYHPDHRATAHIAWQALTNCHFSGHIFSYEISSQQACANYLIDISSVIDKKREMMALYQSQIEKNNYIDVITSINKSRTYTLPPHIEYAEAFYYFNTPENSLTLNTIEQFRPYWEQEIEQKDILISIIYHTQNSTFSSLQSILEQTYQNIELVLINNGAHTNHDLVKKTEVDLAQIKVLDLSPAQSYSHAMNKGLEQCSGDFILIFEEGDSIYPSHIESLLTAVRQKDARISYSDIITNQGISIKQAFLYPVILSEQTIPLNGLLFSHQFLNTGLKFNTQLSSGERWDFLMQLSQLANFNYLNICGGFSQSSQVKQSASNHLFQHWIKKLDTVNLRNTFRLIEKRLELNEQSQQNQSIQISALDLEIQNNKAILENKDRALIEKDDAILEKDTAIIDLFAAIEEKDNAINEKNTALESLNQRINKLVSEQLEIIKNNEQQMLSVKNSLSWRITRPLRKIKTLLTRHYSANNS